jgi:hypothetical protein
VVLRGVDVSRDDTLLLDPKPMDVVFETEGVGKKGGSPKVLS